MEPAIKTRPVPSSPFSLWLSWQELTGRKMVFFINVIIVALLVALPVSLELIGKARKSSIDVRVDYMGPSLLLVPEGILSSDLVTARLKGKAFPDSYFRNIHGDMQSHLRTAEQRLTQRLNIKGRNTPVTGIDFAQVYSYPFSQYSLDSDDALLGSIAAEKLGKDRGDTLQVGSGSFRIAGIIPVTGGIEDASIFLSLPVMQRLLNLPGQINEIRIFPRSLESYKEMKPLLKAYPELHMIDAYRGDTAEKEVGMTLNSYQKALYTVAFVLIALCILISTYINLDSRKAEVSTIYTLGTSQSLVLQTLVYRTVWITLLGALAGQVLALVIAVFQDTSVPVRFLWSTASFMKISVATIFLGVFVTIPFALHSVYRRDPVAHL